MRAALRRLPFEEERRRLRRRPDERRREDRREDQRRRGHIDPDGILAAMEAFTNSWPWFEELWKRVATDEGAAEPHPIPPEPFEAAIRAYLSMVEQ